MVATYLPDTAPAGTDTDSVGFHDAELVGLPLASVNAARAAARFTAVAAVGWPGVNVPVPVTAVAGPDQ